jgi:hypothetical protein
MFVFPVVVGGGKPALPQDVRMDLELLDERRIGNGVVHMYRAGLRIGRPHRVDREHPCRADGGRRGSSRQHPVLPVSSST